MADLDRTVTPELALAAAGVIKLYCKQQHNCYGCVIDGFVCNEDVFLQPDMWEIPERKKDGDLQR